LPTFEHGVASGDPLGDRVVLWTRVSGVDGDADVSWSISRDEDLSDPVSSGTTTTGPDRDHTVKVDATGLEPGNSYFYGFEFDGEDSPTGRTSTLPDDPQHLTFAVTSCAK
jgi:alkaline phosphatase D